MNVDWAVTCRYAESDGRVATLVGAGVDLFQVPGIPAQVAGMMAVRLASTADEMLEEHTLSCRVLDPDGAPIKAQDGTEAPPMSLAFQAQEIQQAVPGWLVNPLFTFGIQWIAFEAGTYSIEVWVDDGAPHRSPVHVVVPDA